MRIGTNRALDHHVNMESMFLYRDCNDNFNFHPKYSIDNNLLTFVYIMTILPPVMCSTHSFVNGINQYVVMTVVMVTMFSS